MSDLSIYRTANGLYDLDFNRGDLMLTDGLENAIIVSLACWARDTDISQAANIIPTLGGWWGNSLEDVEIGSQIWKLFSRKLTDLTAEKGAAAASSALKWMVDDGVAKTVDVESSIVDNVLLFVIRIEKPNSSKHEFKWQINWEASNAI